MISELNRKRWRKFRKQKRSVVALVLFAAVAAFSFTAELWSNSKPVLLRYRGGLFVPAYRDYHPSAFGIEDEVQTDYRELEKKFTPGDWALWPVNRWDPFESNKEVEKYPAPPSRLNVLGTDDRGRDILARVMYGFRYSIAYASIVWALTVIIGIVAGGVMGFFGGWIDLLGQRVVEVLNTIPILFLLIILVSIFEPSLLMLVLLTSCFSWIGLSYYVRGEFLKNRKMEFVEAARSLGARNPRLIFRHVLPNSLIPVITFSPFIISSHILGLASLDYLGFGLRPPTPSWGELLNQAQQNFTIAWWLAVYPGLALFSTLVMLALIGDGVRNAFDPRK